MENSATLAQKILSFLRTALTKKQIIVFSIFASAVFYSYFFIWQAPYDFPVGKITKVEEGMSLKATSAFLEKEKIVRSGFWLGNLVILFAGEDKVIARDYYFEKPISIFRVALLLTDRSYIVSSFKITIPEGLSVKEITDIYDTKLMGFDRASFIEKALPLEGYLFPDTYFFFPTTSEDEVIEKMKENFDNQIKKIEKNIKNSGRTLRDIVTMASILELEGDNYDDRAIISGILWKRINMGMALQVDASFIYINNKGSLQLTNDDLKIDSPYNTYKYRGLPPTPISNPGLESLLASAVPQKSPYLYYLSDSDGVMHYARGFEEHKRNKREYLQ
ncbi:MAG: endolytic transglycosylase MltG [Patescibacteria group bacterium]